jgi:hypothetical protein
MLRLLKGCLQTDSLLILIITILFLNLILWEEEIRKPKEEKFQKVHLEKAGLQNPEKIKKQNLKNQNNVDKRFVFMEQVYQPSNSR